MTDPGAVVLHLGGNEERARTTREAIRSIGPGRLVVSAEAAPAVVLDLLGGTTGPLPPRYFDARPWDTVTHFVWLRFDLRIWRTCALYIVTDRAHLRRAVLVARIILAGSGVRIVGVPHDGPEARRVDPLARLAKDILRALWLRLTRHLVYDRRIRGGRHAALQAAAIEATRVGFVVLRHPDGRVG